MINQPNLQHGELTEELIRFATDLRWARRLAGDPPYRALTRKFGYSPTTITRNLSGAKLPTWDFVENFLAACEVETSMISDTWKPRWVKIANMVDPISDKSTPTLPRAQAAPAGAACEDCGAWVVDVAAHEQWHQGFVPQRRTFRRLAG